MHDEYGNRKPNDDYDYNITTSQSYYQNNDEKLMNSLQNNRFIKFMEYLEVKDNRFTCKLCGKSYKNKRHFNRHVKEECIHCVRRYKCTQCDMYFKRKYHLDRHVLSKHTYHNSRPQFSALYREEPILMYHQNQTLIKEEYHEEPILNYQQNQIETVINEDYS